jgi:hypothetical protein
MTTWRRLSGPAALCALTLAAALTCTPAAHAAAIDGISDQNLPFWDAAPNTGSEGNLAARPFAQYFHNVWTRAGHIQYARYVLQWNAKATGGYAAFESWYSEVTQELKLTPVLAFYNFRWREEANPSESQYRAALTEVLETHPGIAVVEPWNEPNGSGVSEAVAAHYANAAFRLCRAAGCTVLAGDFLDRPGSLSYARKYKEDLSPAYAPLMKDWALHPYAAVNRSSPEAESIRSSVFAGANLWITEIGSYYCEEHSAEPSQQTGEAEQNARAENLVDNVIPKLQPIHVFYYEFLYKDFALTPCEGGQSDTALYNPDDAARRAARVIFGAALPQVVQGEANALLADANPGNPLASWPSYSGEA